MVLLIALLAGAAVFVLARWLIVERAPVAVPAPAGTLVPEAVKPARRGQRVEEKLDTIGVRMSATTFALLRLVVGVVLLILALVAQVPVGFALVLGAVGSFLPLWWLGWEIDRQARLLAQELPGAAEDIAGALRVQRSVRPALQDVSAALKRVNPGSLLAREFDRVLVDTEAAGGAIEVGLQRLQERARNQDLVRLAGTLLVFQRAGPDMLDILASKATETRANLEMRAEIQTSLSEQRFLMQITPLLAVGAYFFLSSDPLVHQFQRSLAGQILILLVAGAMGLGYLIVQSMIQDAEP